MGTIKEKISNGIFMSHVLAQFNDHTDPNEYLKVVRDLTGRETLKICKRSFVGRFLKWLGIGPSYMPPLVKYLAENKLKVKKDSRLGQRLTRYSAHHPELEQKIKSLFEEKVISNLYPITPLLDPVEPFHVEKTSAEKIMETAIQYYGGQCDPKKWPVFLRTPLDFTEHQSIELLSEWFAAFGFCPIFISSEPLRTIGELQVRFQNKNTLALFAYHDGKKEHPFFIDAIDDTKVHIRHIDGSDQEIIPPEKLLETPLIPLFILEHPPLYAL